ncbi:MAG: hypothetical protein EOO44_18825 [Flavobacterium sp.]|nr:MAG: hypothetical protein EOO44_18825 [Flavobacterium sp.]
MFEVNDQEFTKIYDHHGILCLKKLNENYLLAGNYNGIAIFEKKGNTWKFLKKMKFILGAVNQIIVDDGGNIFANIPNYGVMKFRLDKNLQPQNRQFISVDHLKGNFPSFFRDEKDIRAITSTSQYDYNPSQNTFIENNHTSHHGKIKNLFSGFYMPIILDKNYGFYSVNNGFALEKFINDKIKPEFSSLLLFRKASAFNNDSAIDLVNGDEVCFKYNNLRFSFLVPNEDGVEYEYFLKNFSKDWSGWSKKNTAEFLGLKEGSYVLQIRAKNQDQISTSL